MGLVVSWPDISTSLSSPREPEGSFSAIPWILFLRNVNVCPIQAVSALISILSSSSPPLVSYTVCGLERGGVLKCAYTYSETERLPPHFARACSIKHFKSAAIISPSSKPSLGQRGFESWGDSRVMIFMCKVALGTSHVSERRCFWRTESGTREVEQRDPRRAK